MNLVKAQEYAQSLPLAELKKYADGLNPSMIPPWLATGEMQAKMKRAEMANALQGAAQGQQPSVKEQVEQKAGLMALQQAQQQGMPGQVPEGIPQPNPQPQAPGLNQLPSNIQMAGGGIVAFAGPTGSDVKGSLEDDEDLPMWARAARAKKRKAAAEMEAERERNMAIARAEGQNLRPTMQNDPRMLRAPAEETVGELPAAPKPPMNNLAQLAAAQNKPRPPAMPAMPAAPAAPTAPAAPAPNSMEAMFRTSLENKPKERTVQDLIAEQNAIRAGTGLGEDAGKAKLERIAALNQQYESTKPSGLQELIQMLGTSGQYKGLSGLAPAYTNIETQKRAADLAHAKQINELMGGVEDTQRAEKVGVAGKVGEGRAKSLEQQAQFDREQMQTLGTARGQDVQSASAKYNADMHYKAAMAQMSNANARQDAQEKRLLLDSFKTRIASIDKELAPLLKTPYGPAKAQIAELQAEKAGLTKALDETSGISKIAGAPGARSPGGTTRLQFDAKGNQIK
jgi:hypothetical protein